MRVGLADDSSLFRRGLRRLLEDMAIEVAVDCRTGEELLRALRAEPLDAVVLDIRMPPTYTSEGLDTAEAIRREQPQVGVLVLSTYAEASYAYRLLASGTSHLGYLLKDRVDDPEALLDALRRVTEGGSVVDPEIVAQLVTQHTNEQILSRLSDREREVLALMGEGKSNAGISQQLVLSQKTVETHIASIFAKLNIRAESDTNRRVRAVLAWLDARGAL